MGAQCRSGRGPVVRHGSPGFQHVGLAGGVRSGSWPLPPEKRRLEILSIMRPTDRTPPDPGHQILADARPRTVRSGRRFHLIPLTAS
jgi:hypothetical protein